MKIKLKKALQLIAIMVLGIFMVATVVGFAHQSAERVLANGPIAPPEGYPKLSLSTKVVSPTLTDTFHGVLEYRVQILNTGAFTATDVTLVDAIPANTIYNMDASSSAPPTPVFTDGVLTWEHGVVGFDDSVEITFTVTVTPGFEGIISNTAVISDPLIAEPVSVIAETRVTDTALFEISKSAQPALPGKNKPLTYELVVENVGQPAVNTPITVTDFVPTDTTFLSVGPGGSVSPAGDVVTWTRSVNMAFGETTSFTYSVTVNDVQSGTVINNDVYLVVGLGHISAGAPYTTTVVDPIFELSKSIYPDPPGANTNVTYTLSVVNLGSLATEVVITDRVPAEVTYVAGGDSFENGIVTWNLPSLDTRESAQVTFTGSISDIAGIIALNNNYAVCSAEGVCASGVEVPSLIVGPTFEATAILDPIAHKPGGGIAPVTPTLTIENLGPANAIDATALLTFGRISISANDMEVIPPVGSLVEGPPCDEPFPCTNFVWTGDMAIGDVITFTTTEPQSTIGGEEGTHYTATLVITDELGAYVTPPVTAEAIGRVTHFANLLPTKTAPEEIGPGQVMTYTIQVLDSGLSTEETPPPVLTETVPASVTLLSISDGGISQTIENRTTISWTLPAMGPGDILDRSFAVLTDPDLVSGTLIINDDYRTTWYESDLPGFMTNLGEPVTTTVHEVGLIDSYKEVTPTWALPGTGIVLNYVLHVVNSGPNDLTGVQVSDIFPWEHTTYQRDAVASAGTLSSDIVSLEWVGDVAPYSEQLITFTTVVDDFFDGVVTNTATISHTSLKQPVEVSAVAYITTQPVLQITKKATPDPVAGGGTLLYQIEVTNLANQASQLTISDTLPANTIYVPDSASSGGQLVGNTVVWRFPVLNHDDVLQLTFQVLVFGGDEVINAEYSATCAEGVSAHGLPVVTRVVYPVRHIYMPLSARN